TNATAKPVDPILRDPILLRNCQAEYDQAMKTLAPATNSGGGGSGGGGGGAQMGGAVQQPSTMSSGETLGNDAAGESVRLDVLRNRALLNKVEFRTEQANRKLDYVLNVNVPRR